MDLEYEDIPTLGTSIGRFYQTPHGNFPSVTTILSVDSDKSFLKEWRERVGEEQANKISNEATSRGTKVHSLIEHYLKGEEIDLSNPLLRGHFNQIQKILDRFEVIYANEIPLYSKALKTAGCCDCIAKVNGEIQIVDFKTSKHSKTFEEIESYKMQCAAYTFMANEMFGLKIKKFSILLSNLYENHCDFYEGESKDYIQKFWELRKKWQKNLTSNNS